MTSVRILAAMLTAGLLTLVARAEEKPDYAKLIVGKWTATKTDDGTLPEGTNVEFTKDGKIIIAAKMGDQEFKIEGTYKVEGDAFNMTMKLGDDSKTQKITIKKISDTEMNTTDKDGKTANFKRAK